MAGLVNFEDENEVTEFLDNLGMEYSFQCYKEKDPEGCQRLADYFEGVKQNYESSAKVLKHNCETYGHGESCLKLGSYHITGRGGVAECMNTAYSCYLRACNAEGKQSLLACHNAATLVQGERVLSEESYVNEARQYYEKACAGGYAPSCFNLSAWYITGNSGSMSPDMTLALKYANRACEMGHVYGCANASRMYRLGEGTEMDDKKAKELMKRAKELHGLAKEREIKFGE